MKFFERPEIKVKSFDRISVLTASEPTTPTTAVDKALADAAKLDDSVGTFIVDIG